MSQINEASFESISLEEFFGSEELSQDRVQTGIVVYTDYQQHLIDHLRKALAQNAPDRIERLESRLSDVEALAKSIALFPSLLERANTTTSMRTPEALIESLISYPEDGDTTLHMPSKAILGKGFLVTKIHTFFSMSKLAKNDEGIGKLSSQFNWKGFILYEVDVNVFCHESEHHGDCFVSIFLDFLF